MSATRTVEGLIQAGTTLKAAWATARQDDPDLDWQAFVGSNEFNAAYGEVSQILSQLSRSEVDKALGEVRAKQAALLNGQSIMNLPTEKLAQYDALLDTENLLMRKYAANFTKTAEAVAWLIDDALPTLLRVAKVVLPLLL